MKFGGLRISSVSVTKSAGNCGFGHITEEILNRRLHFFYSACSKKQSKFHETIISFEILLKNHCVKPGQKCIFLFHFFCTRTEYVNLGASTITVQNKVFKNGPSSMVCLNTTISLRKFKGSPSHFFLGLFLNT